MRIRFDIDISASSGTASGGVSQRVMLVVPPSLCLVGDLLHHLHRRLALPQQPLTPAVDGFSLLPAQRLADVLREGDIVQVRAAAGVIDEAESPCAAKRRRVAAAHHSGLLALENGQLALPAPALANEVASVATPCVNSGANNACSAGSELSRSGQKSEATSKHRKHSRPETSSQGRKLQAKAGKLADAASRKKCSFGQEVFPALAPPPPRAVPALAALPAPSAGEVESDDCEEVAPAGAAADGGARAILASRARLLGNAAAGDVPPKLPPLDCKLWKAVARDPMAGEVLKYRAARQGALSAHQVSWCRAVESSEDGAVCILRGADGLEQRLLMSTLLQVSVHVGKASSASIPKEKAGGVSKVEESDAEERGFMPSVGPSPVFAGDEIDSFTLPTPMLAEESVISDCKGSVAGAVATAESAAADFPAEAKQEVLASNPAEMSGEEFEKLCRALVRQIDYYFGNRNYAKDNWLRGQADEDGWTSLVLLAKFNRMRELTRDFALVVQCARSSDVVDVSDCGCYIRKVTSQSSAPNSRRHFDQSLAIAQWHGH